jgi:ATP-dependent Lon protease
MMMEVDNDNEILKLKQNLGYKENDKKVISDLNKCTTRTLYILHLEFNNDYELWLDKYKATDYGDLLTDEKMTRDILYWIKSWDDVVFGKKFESTRTIFTKEKNVNEFGGGILNNQNIKKDIEYNHNKHKIILIAGPPGMGKTTLARVLANHCKYEPIVVNLI